MYSRIFTVLFSVILATASAQGQDKDAPKAEKKEQATKSAEIKPDNGQAKTDPLADFEKQLQKELEGTPDKPTNGAEQPSVLWQFIRTLLTLAFLLAIFYGVFRLYKFKRGLPSQNFSAITSIYEYPLGNNNTQRLQILEIAGRLMILGVSEQSVQLISEVTDKYTIDRIKLDCAEDSKAPREDFLTALSRSIKQNISDRFGKKSSSNFNMPAQGGADTLEAQRQSSLERLRKLKSDKHDWRDKL